MAKQTSAEFRALVADAMAHFQAGRLAEAESAYRAALAIVPADPAVTHNLGVAIAAQGRHRDAIGCFDDGAHGRSRLRLGALQPRRRADGARRDAGGDQGLQPRRCARAAALRGASRAGLPLAGARRARAGARSFRAHLRAAARRRPDHHRAQVVDDDDARTSSNTMPSSSCYLSQRTRDRLRFELLARNYGDDCGAAPGRGELAVRCADRGAGRGLQHADPSARGARDRGPRRQRTGGSGLRSTAQFERARARSSSTICSRRTALDSLRRFLLESTIWHDFSHIDGFVASYLEDGLACPLLLQIADELRARVSRYSRRASADARPGRSKACGRRRPSTCMPTMPPSASISGSRRREANLEPGRGAAWSSAGRRRPRIGRSRTTTPTRRGS